MEKRFRVAELKNEPNHWLLTELGEDAGTEERRYASPMVRFGKWPQFTFFLQVARNIGLTLAIKSLTGTWCTNGNLFISRRAKKLMPVLLTLRNR